MKLIFRARLRACMLVALLAISAGAAHADF